jgi:uncharacterized membrane protein (UPF0127 family)
LEPLKNANPVSVGLVVAALALALCGCGSGKAPDAPAAVKGVSDHFTVSVGGHPVSLQFAVLEPEQERGLMQRADLGKDEGMIFVDAAPKKETYWMKDTPEALDIAFAGPDGVIQEIYPMYPFDERVVASRGDQLQMAVEMRQGWFSANGVHAGDSVDMKAVTDALRARGFDPARFKLR